MEAEQVPELFPPPEWQVTGGGPVEWILPALIVVAWIVQWAATRRMPWWAFFGGLG